MRKKQRYKRGEKYHIFDNIVNREFKTKAPNDIWCTDFTYLTLRNGQKRYNCTILDLYDRSFVASLNIKWIDSDLAINTLRMALEINKANRDLILRGDQGSQLASRSFIDYCCKNNITQGDEQSW
jgi:transposase InsO family protein